MHYEKTYCGFYGDFDFAFYCAGTEYAMLRGKKEEFRIVKVQSLFAIMAVIANPRKPVLDMERKITKAELPSEDREVFVIFEAYSSHSPRSLINSSLRAVSISLSSHISFVVISEITLLSILSND